VLFIAKTVSETPKAGVSSGKPKAPAAEKPAKKDAKASKPAKKGK